MNYQIDYLPTVVSDDIPVLPKAMRGRIQKSIEEKLGHAPMEFGKPLRYSWRGHFRLRVGDWRVIYRVAADTQTVTIVKIMHRKDIYED